MRYFGFVLVAASIVMFGVVTCYGVIGRPGWDLEPVRMTVIRKDTGRPERDVVVAATWMSVEVLTVHGEQPVRVLRTAEAVTDTTGLAVIPAAHVDRKGFEKLAWSAPWLIVYKRGFVTESFDYRDRRIEIRPAKPWEDLPAHGKRMNFRGHFEVGATDFPRLHLELNSPRPLSRTPPAP